MTRVRLFPVALVGILMFALLLGGWTVYQQKGIIQPITQQVGAISGVAAVKTTVNNRELRVVLTLGRSADLLAAYQAVEKAVDPLKGGRELRVSIQDKPNDTLNQVAKKSVPSLYEAIGTEKFTMIERWMDNAVKQHLLTKYDVQLDQNYVYISLFQDKAYKYLVIPRDDRLRGGTKA